jgi:hypothetical protein
MNEKELDLELDKIHEEGDEMFIPNSLVEEIVYIAVEKEIKKYTEKR